MFSLHLNKSISYTGNEEFNSKHPRDNKGRFTLKFKIPKAGESVIYSGEFKKWFGDWEFRYRLNKVLNSIPLKTNIPAFDQKDKDILRGNLKRELLKSKEHERVFKCNNTNDEFLLTNAGIKKIFVTSAAAQKLGVIMRLKEVINSSEFLSEASDLQDDIMYRYYGCKIRTSAYPERRMCEYLVRITVKQSRNGLSQIYDLSLSEIKKRSDPVAFPGSKPGAYLQSDQIELQDKRLNYLMQEKSSKCVDENGKPLIVYHGTGNDFSKFRYTQDLGYHFGNSEQANLISGDHGAGGNIMPVYLSVKNPVFTSDAYAWYHIRPTLRVLQEAGAVSEKEAEAILGKQVSESGKLKLTRSLLIKKGYDGIIYENDVEGKGRSFIVFDSSQIKSATGNNGLFNPGRKDITKSCKTVFLLKAAGFQNEQKSGELAFSDLNLYSGRV